MHHHLAEVPSNVLGEITLVLQSILGRPVFLRPEMNIVADLGLDSLAVMNFCMALEDRLDISIPLHQMADVVSVGDLAETIDSLRAKG